MCFTSCAASSKHITSSASGTRPAITLRRTVRIVGMLSMVAHPLALGIHCRDAGKARSNRRSTTVCEPPQVNSICGKCCRSAETQRPDASREHEMAVQFSPRNALVMLFPGSASWKLHNMSNSPCNTNKHCALILAEHGHSCPL